MQRLESNDQKLLDVAYVRALEAYRIEFVFEDQTTQRAFHQIANGIYETLYRTKSLQHRKGDKFTQTNLWKWIRAQRPELENRYTHLSIVRGQPHAEQFIRDEWDKAHPPRPEGRPPGLLTNGKLRAIANARALTWLLNTVAAQTGNGKAQRHG
jgi:hypothetical protein